jgi:hypothetical protein
MNRRLAQGNVHVSNQQKEINTSESNQSHASCFNSAHPRNFNTKIDIKTVYTVHDNMNKSASILQSDIDQFASSLTSI